MTSDHHTVYIEPDGRRIRAAAGQPLTEALTHAGLFLRADCGGKGRCGKCRIRVKADSAGTPGDIPAQAGRTHFPSSETQDDRLACQLVVDRDMHIEIPEMALLRADVIQKAPVSLPADLAAARPLGARERFGVAVDLGTTTIALYLCALDALQVLGSVSIKNPQAQFGDDIMSRIGVIREKADTLKRMQSMAVNAIQWGVLTLASRQRIDPQAITRMAVVGNTTMIHILAGESPASLGVYPFTPRFSEGREFPGKAVGFFELPGLRVETLPLISAFLGSDILAAALGTDFQARAPGTVLADVGTNGEVMLRTPNGILATSCATGPAFEGASLSCGMHAIAGAVDGITIEAVDCAPVCSVIAPKNSAATRVAGICGSGVVSAVAEAYRHQILNPDGSFNTKCGSPALLVSADGPPALILVAAEASATGRPVAVSQRDIRAIQLAKGALRAGIEMLLKADNRQRPRQIQLAGAFGSYLAKQDVLAIGMLPPVRAAEITIVGNAAGVGAIRYLLEADGAARINTIKGCTEVVHLATDPAFQKAFIDALSFPKIPHTV
ncbi:MAG: ASKHA domain-containing protein [Desulfosarcinaceae bacterium]|nr:ASKHA domain-containing protein [Desulfosarcinaceae bacterium]